MFLVGIFQWWYGSGWLRHLKKSYTGILRTADFFSIDLLIRTLFNPFRQISASGSQGPFPVRFRAFLDRLFSRCIGAVFRTLAIVLGSIVISIRSVWVLASMIVWTLLPFLPVIGVALWLGEVSL